MVVIIPQCKHISNYYVVPRKLIGMCQLHLSFNIIDF